MRFKICFIKKPARAFDVLAPMGRSLDRLAQQAHIDIEDDKTSQQA